MKKLIFKVSKNTMGVYKYIGFRKWIGENTTVGSDLYGNLVLINPDEYMELGFVDKPDVANWKNKISEADIRRGKYGILLGWGDFKKIEFFLSTHHNLTPLD